MDQSQLQQNIALYYSKLPPTTQQVFSRMAWMETLKTISAKYNLTASQIETLATETTLVLLGIIHLDEYDRTLISELALPKETADKMMIEINDSILKNIRPELEEAFTNNVQSLSENKEENDSNTKLDPRFASMPVGVQEAIARSDYQKKLYEIATKNKLQVTAMASLEDITVRLITNKISPSQYENELALATDLPADKVREIANDVNTNVLAGIRALMQKGDEVEKNDDDDVPIPPYAISSPVFEKKVESKIYEDSGIEIVKSPKKEENINIDEIERETVSIKKEDSILSNSGINIIEGPGHSDSVSTNIISNKLGGITKNINTTTDYSVPKISKIPTPTVGAQAPSKAHDPYHEAIE